MGNDILKNFSYPDGQNFENAYMYEDAENRQ